VSRRGGGFGGGGEDFSRGRKFSSDDLQLLLLALLVEAPRHGYELIRLLEVRSNGFYTPSPGMIYPALTYLEETGYTSVTADGNRKSYALTAQGSAYVEANRERIDVIWAKLNFLGKKMGLVRRALAGDETEDAGSSEPLEELHAARHRLKHLLFALADAPPAEQLRVAKILERAIADIARPSGDFSKEN
jgi:DNA-binding PadR family transcriptional regulator